MKTFLCTFVAIVAVVNGHAIQSAGQYGPNAPVVGGSAYQILPAVSVATIGSAGGYGSPGYGGASLYDLNALMNAYASHLSPLNAAKLSLQLPRPHGLLTDLAPGSYAIKSSYAGAPNGKLAYLVAPAYKTPITSYSAPEYKAPAATYSAPAYEAPIASYSAPEYKAPAATYSAPAYKAPVASYSAPEYKAPAATYGAPAYKSPVAAYSAPQYKAPTTSYNAPAKAQYPSASVAGSYVADKYLSAPASKVSY